MEKCIFCQIASKKVKSFVIKENENFVACLDIYPITKAQALIISKQHFPSDPLKVHVGILEEGIKFAKEVGELLVKKLGAKRVIFVIEGMEIDHFHIKLYPFYELSASAVPADSISVKLEGYPGFILTLHGERAKDKDLEAVLKKLKS